MNTDNKGGVIGTCLKHVPPPPAQHYNWGGDPLYTPHFVLVSGCILLCAT